MFLLILSCQCGLAGCLPGFAKAGGIAACEQDSRSLLALAAWLNYIFFSHGGWVDLTGMDLPLKWAEGAPRLHFCWVEFQSAFPEEGIAISCRCPPHYRFHLFQISQSLSFMPTDLSEAKYKDSKNGQG